VRFLFCTFASPGSATEPNMPEFEIPIEDRVIAEHAAAAMMGISLPTLRRRVRAGNGPPVIRLSERRIGYRLRDLRKWLDANTEQPTAA
jgi:predicted DNA-binding transcriptional regulator AlpA